MVAGQATGCAAEQGRRKGDQVRARRCQAVPGAEAGRQDRSQAAEEREPEQVTDPPGQAPPPTRAWLSQALDQPRDREQEAHRRGQDTRHGQEREEGSREAVPACLGHHHCKGETNDCGQEVEVMPHEAPRLAPDRAGGGRAGHGAAPGLWQECGPPYLACSG